MKSLIKIFLASLTPIGELRLSIPLGLGEYSLPIWQVYIISVIGNFIPPLFILLLLPKISDWLMKNSKLMNKFLTWLYDRTRKRTQAKIEQYRSLALILFVAIPLPYTGAWTGSLAAFLFNIPYKKAIPNILIGILIAGIIMTLGTLGFIKLF